MCVCVCVCVCERERDGERDRKRERELMIVDKKIMMPKKLDFHCQLVANKRATVICHFDFISC